MFKILTQGTFDKMEAKITHLNSTCDRLASQNNKIYEEKTKLTMERYPIYDTFHKLKCGEFFAFDGEIWKCDLSKEGWAEIGHIDSVSKGTWNILENAYDAPDEVLEYFELRVIDLD